MADTKDSNANSHGSAANSSVKKVPDDDLGGASGGSIPGLLPCNAEYYYTEKCEPCQFFQPRWHFRSGQTEMTRTPYCAYVCRDI